MFTLHNNPADKDWVEIIFAGNAKQRRKARRAYSKKIKLVKAQELLEDRQITRYTRLCHYSHPARYIIL